jgi:hypothetical protein
VHEIAEPIVYHATRAATAPIRVAYVTTRARAVPELRAEPVDDAMEADETAPSEDGTPEQPQFENNGSRPMVDGSCAVLRNGIAYAQRAHRKA